jgi:hypothetical protein
MEADAPAEQERKTRGWKAFHSTVYTAIRWPLPPPPPPSKVAAYAAV